MHVTERKQLPNGLTVTNNYLMLEEFLQGEIKRALEMNYTIETTYCQDENCLGVRASAE